MTSTLILVLALAIAQDSVSAVANQARALINGGKPREAVVLLEKAQAGGAPLDPLSKQLLGVALYHADEYARAIETLTPVVDQLPEASTERREAVQVLGLSLYLAGRFTDAIPRK